MVYDEHKAIMVQVVPTQMWWCTDACFLERRCVRRLERILIVIAVLLSAVVLPQSAVAAGSTVDERFMDPEFVQDLAKRLTSPGGDKVWDSMTEKEKESYIKAMEIVSVTIQVDEAAGPVDTRTSASSLAGSRQGGDVWIQACSPQVTHPVEGKTLLGFTAYKIWQYKTWCYDGWNTWNEQWSKSFSDVNAAFQFVQWTEDRGWSYWHSNGETHVSRVQAQFCNWVFGYGCISWYYPWIEIYANQNGSWVGLGQPQ